MRPRLSSRRSAAATGSSSTTSPTRCWPGNPRRCASSCSAYRRTRGARRTPLPRRHRPRRRHPDARSTRARQPLRRPLRRGSVRYRYHHLFGDVLHARLLAEHARTRCRSCTSGPAPTPTNRSASIRTGGAARARGRGLQKGRAPGRGGPFRAERGREDGLLLSWARSLPDSVVRRNPRRASCPAGRPLWPVTSTIQARLDDAESALAEGPLDRTERAKRAYYERPADGTGDDRGLPRVPGTGARKHGRNAWPMLAP